MEARNYLLSTIDTLPPEIEKATKIILAQIDELKKNLVYSMTTLENLGIDGETVDALNFLRSLPSLPMNYEGDENPFIEKLNAAVKVLRNNPAVWYNANDLPHEIWRDVIGYEGLYKVSNYGRLKSLKWQNQKNMNVIKTANGYVRYHLRKNDTPKILSAHRLVAISFLPNPEGKPQVNHKSKSGDKENNCVWNLEWATSSENQRHAIQTGLKRIGADCPLAKLTAEQVRWIREYYIPYDKEFGVKALAERFGTNVSTIYRVVHYQLYKNV